MLNKLKNFCSRLKSWRDSKLESNYGFGLNVKIKATKN